ncbi:MAG: helix-turn-helix domain-containing protein [Elusimicrobia bacterium]|nr:helix-turn-helix domain-containing protein [Candidatus Obscuribacterium magneticum]
MTPIIKQYQQNIAKRVKELRRERRLTQKELADYLGLSQNRISQIEAGQGSFSAEHLLLLAKKFNVPASSFVSEKRKADPTIQNALARHGASHLREDEETLPSEKLDDVLRLVREVLVAPESPRAVAALAPVIVQHAEPRTLNRIRLQLKDDGVIQRYGWLLENIQRAINEELAEDLSEDWRTKYKRADFIFKNLLASPWFESSKADREDLIDSVVTEKTLEELRVTSSDISKKWKVITRIQPSDFAQALKEARETY